MKQTTYILTVLFASLFFFSACDREKMEFSSDTDAYGQVNLSSLGLTINVDATPVSRADAPDVSDYIVGIYSEDGVSLVSEWKYSEMPEIFQLKVGSYQLKAHAPQGNMPSFDTPYCEGSRNFEIQKDQVTSIAAIDCTLRCIAVAIRYDAEFEKLLGDDVQVTVKVGGESGQPLVYEKGETRIGYFMATGETNVVDVNFLGTIDGEDEVPITNSYAGINVGELLTVTYTLKDANGDPGSGGDVDVALKVDTRCDVENLDGTVRPDKEPGIEDFPSGDGDGEEPGEGAPAITVDSDSKLDILNAPIYANTYNKETDGPVALNLQASGTIENLIVKIATTEGSGFDVAVKDLFGSDSFDLANPPADPDYRNNLKNLGFPLGDSVKTTEVVSFDITQFISLITVYKGTHTFEITLKDAKGASATATLTIIVN